MTSTNRHPMFDNLDRQQLTRRRLVFGGIAAAATMPLAGCGGGTEVLFAPFFVFSFEGVIDRRLVNVSFSPQSSVLSSGNFDSFSTISVRDPNDPGFSVDSTFVGSFNGRDLQLTLANPSTPLVASYGGRFTADDTVLLTPSGSSGAAFSVRRNENDGFLPTLTGDWIGTDGAGSVLRWRLDTDPMNRDDLATVLLSGSEVRGTAAPVAMLGYASIRFIELNIPRASGTVRLTGRLQPPPTTPVPGTPQTTATILIDGGGSLVRV